MRTFTRRQVLSAGALAVPLGLGGRPNEPTRTLATAARLQAEDLSAIAVVQTTRIGQLTGTTGATWPLLVDPVGWPLQTDTGRWNVIGVDEGANAKHSDGRTYFFFGDVATDQSGTPPENSDLVAWTDEPTLLRHGGHLAEGWTFQLPLTGPGVEGQPDWQFCLKCSALFWNGDARFKGRCPAGEAHDTFNLGLNFSLPFQPTSIAGQVGWRFCGKCAGLFWTDEQGRTGTCPAGGVHDPAGWTFVLPVAPASTGGQSDWRFCGNCHGLFWDGEASKGLCSGAPGGGFHLRAVLRDQTPAHPTQVGPFDPFRAADPIGYLGSFETPNGAFSFDGTMYVFGGFTEQKYGGRRRPGDPMTGDYLFSKRDPATPGPYATEFLFAPKLGWCATDEGRSTFESHAVLGLHFIVPHDLANPAGRLRSWRSCAKCEALFWDGDPSFKGVCQRGGAHEADPAIPAEFMLEADLPEDDQHQANWHRCRKCLALSWAGDPSDAGHCPAGGQHEPTEGALRVPHVFEDAHHQPFWRFCHKCFALYWDGSNTKGSCPKDHGPHEAAGYDFTLPHDLPEDATHQTNWQFCGKCNALFFDGYADKGVCPQDGGGHAKVEGTFAGSPWPATVFTLQHSLPAETPTQQTHWHYCGKCASLFFDGYAEKGVCPKDGGGHAAAGLEFALTHNPEVDANNRGAFRFCVRCHELVRTDQPSAAPWVAPTVVDNATHAVLRQDEGQGLVMLTYDGGYFRLLWMPLTPGTKPRFDTIRYYHAGQDRWSDTPDFSDGSWLFAHPQHRAHPDFVYTHVSATWLPGPGLWVVLYSAAWNGIGVYTGPINARFSPDLMTWSDDFPLFTPGEPGAYVPFMHDPNRPHPDGLWPNEPPADPKNEVQGWAYGAFIIERYTTWDAGSGALTLTYLMSTAAPYQVQVMQTTLRVPAFQPRTLVNPAASPGVAGAATPGATPVVGTPGATPVAATPGATPVVATEPPVPAPATVPATASATVPATEVPTAPATAPATAVPTTTPSG